jgi:hypothetical protein
MRLETAHAPVETGTYCLKNQVQAYIQVAAGWNVALACHFLRR